MLRDCGTSVSLTPEQSTDFWRYTLYALSIFMGFTQRTTLFLVLLWCPHWILAQPPETKGWFFLSHTQTITKKVAILFDAQVRSADQLRYVNTLLLRSGVAYNLNKKHSVALGYAYKGDWERQEDGVDRQIENRIYEQYLFESTIGKSEVTARFRFEQRFVKEDVHYLFSERARAFLALQIPVIANNDFSKGMYVNLQNELFANVHNKQNVNGDFFDQNRLLTSVGYRWNKKIDTEIGYMIWHQKEWEGDLFSHVFQIMITTNLD